MPPVFPAKTDIRLLFPQGRPVLGKRGDEEMTLKELIDLFINERIDSILQGHKEETGCSLEEEEKMLESLEPEVREKFEWFVGQQTEWCAEECRMVYRGAFLDGLNLGCRAFRND